MKKLLALAFLLVAAPAFADSSAMDPAKEKDIRRLLDVTGAGKLGVQVMTQMITSFRTSLPKVPSTFWDDFQKQIRPSELVDMVVPIYDRHFSDEDIKKLIAFYETPAGKKFIAATPAITQESMAAGQEWGKSVAQRVLKQLNQKGLGPDSKQK